MWLMEQNERLEINKNTYIITFDKESHEYIMEYTLNMPVFSISDAVKSGQLYVGEWN